MRWLKKSYQVVVYEDKHAYDPILIPKAEFVFKVFLGDYEVEIYRVKKYMRRGYVFFGIIKHMKEDWQDGWTVVYQYPNNFLNLRKPYRWKLGHVEKIGEEAFIGANEKSIIEQAKAYIQAKKEVHRVA